MEVGTKKLSNEVVRQIGSLQPKLFHSDAVCSTTRHFHTRKGSLDGTLWPTGLQSCYVLEDVYSNINYLQALCQKCFWVKLLIIGENS